MHFHSHEITSLTAASRKALRLYEDRGLLTAIGRDSNGWRIYTAEHLLRVATIKFLQESGLTLDDIATVLADSQTSQPWELAEQRLKARIAEAQEKLAVLHELKNMRIHDTDLPLYAPDVSALINMMIARRYPAQMAHRSGRILQFLKITLAPAQWQTIRQLAEQEITNIDDDVIVLAQEFLDLADLPADSEQVGTWRDKALAYVQTHPGTVHTDFISLGVEQTMDATLTDLWTDGLSPAQLRASAIFD
ncbi:MerR family transcriptional regulator [Arcanobacterium phocisimile]|uniref:MerR family transcriptional regulator n=1 Tax=Arcanobacterium phocisimile TaxID=1302235 RepID=A0ABX7IGQ5_9ACTO|nr:MerR family transcriptional regulator [Arcanobacterium phocisimile]QRV01749.1 MerR family transcriptional regulator [Arcanobacterium phocisimile]